MKTKKNFLVKVLTAIVFLIAIAISTQSYAAANKVSGAPTFSAQIGSVTAGTPGSVTYTITLPCNAASGAGSTGLAYAWTTGSPTGVTFSPTTQALGAGLASVQYTLTVTTDATTAAGTYTFTITTNSANNTSANITFTVDAAPVSYCSSTSTSSTSYISNFSTTGGISNITNNGTGYSASGYGDFTGLTVSQVAGSSVNFSLSMVGTTCGVKIWVDWNNDGTFATTGTEVCYSSGSYVSSASSSFSVPAGQAAGNYRMRVRIDYNLTSPVPCNSITRGETEDYTFAVVIPCSAPSTQASSINFSSVTSSSMTVGWTRGNGNNVLVVAKEGSAPGDPSSGTSYTANAAYGSGNACGGGFVVYNGTGTSVNVTSLNAGTTYYFAIYEYNTVSTCYNTTELSGNQATPMGPLDGTFSSGTSFGANGMYVVNHGTNYWIIGPGVNNGAPNGAYITNDGSTNAFTNTITAYSHFYFDYTFPAGQTEIYLDFDWKGNGESTYDGLKVYSAATTYTPVNTGYPTGTQLGSTWYNLQPTWQHVNITLDPAYAGTTKRIIFTWRNDGSSGTQPPAAVDNIVVTTIAPCTQPSTQATGISFTSVTTNSMTVNWTRGNGNNVMVVAKAGSAPSDPLSGTTYAANAAYGSGDVCGGGFVVYNGTGTNVNVTGLAQNTTYYYAIYEYNTTGTCYNVTELTGNKTTNCTAPSTQATVFTSSAITPESMTIGWTRGNGSNVLVVVRQGSAVNTDPTDGTTYAANANYASGAQIGTGNYVVYNGTGTSVTVTGLTPSTAYYYAIYEFNNCGNVPYNQTQLTGNATTAACNAPSTQASVFTQTPSTTSTNIGWTRGNGDKVLVAIRPIVNVSTDPVNGVTYTANSVYGAGGQLADGSYVVYIGTGTSVNVTSLTSGTTYKFAIYEFNTCNSNTYNITQLTGTSTTNTVATLNYDFVASSGTWSALSGSTTVSFTSGYSSDITIPFTFVYGGCSPSNYTSIRVSESGWIGLGSNMTNEAANNQTYLPSTTYGAKIAPFWDDLYRDGSSVVSYKTTGSTPNRVFTVEWLGMSRWGITTSKRFSFQVKLYETSSKIEFVYGPTANSPMPWGDLAGYTDEGASIGLSGGSIASDYYSLNGTGTSPAANYGVHTYTLGNTTSFPAQGQVYTWTRPTTMTYNSTTVSAATANDTYVSTNNQEITKIAIDVPGSCSADYLTALTISMGATTISDVSNIDVYYTGTENAFSASTIFGSVSPAAGNLTVNGVQQLQSGTNYFWIVYDISAAAVVGHTVSASCSQISLNSAGNKAVSGSGSRIIAETPGTYAQWAPDGRCYSVITASDGDLVWAGSSNSGGDAWIMKTSADLATVRWNKTYDCGTASIDKIIETSTGYAALGYSNISGFYYILMITVNKTTGNKIWANTLEAVTAGQAVTTISSLGGICLTSDGNLAICRNMDDGSSGQDGFFAKINSSTGAIMVKKNFSPSAKSARMHAITQTSDGGYIMAGGIGLVTNPDFYVIKLKADYTLDWDGYWGGANYDMLNFVTENAADDYTVGGMTSSYGFGGQDAYACRFTYSSGSKGFNVIWTRTYGTASNDYFNSGIKTSSGDYAFAGLTDRLGDPGNDEAMAARINTFGGMVFMKSLGTTTSTEDEEAYDIAQMADGNFVVGGLHNNPTVNFYMAKVTGAGYNCATIQDNGGVFTTMPIPTISAGSLTIGDATFPEISSTPTSRNPSNGSGGSITGGCNIDLPVELLYLTGYNKDDENILVWATASEVNNDYFAVESSLNLETWDNIGKVAGAGNSNSILNYSYTDLEPYIGTTYYRLKQTDYDGNFEYSNVVAISKTEDTNSTVKVFPNPFSQTFCIKFSFEPETDYNVEVINFIGQTVKDLKIPAGSFITDVNIEFLPDGLYYVKISNDRTSYIKRVVKESK